MHVVRVLGALAEAELAGSIFWGCSSIPAPKRSSHYGRYSCSLVWMRCILWRNQPWKAESTFVQTPGLQLVMHPSTHGCTEVCGEGEGSV